MQQMVIDEKLLVPLDYESGDLSPSIKQFRPTLFKDDEKFCCLLGPDFDRGIFACGATEEEALSTWEEEFKQRLTSTGEDDEIAKYIRDTLATKKDDVW
jgi:hypothetical protein